MRDIYKQLGRNMAKRAFLQDHRRTDGQLVGETTDRKLDPPLLVFYLWRKEKEKKKAWKKGIP